MVGADNLKSEVPCLVNATYLPSSLAVDTIVGKSSTCLYLLTPAVG